MRTPTGIDLKVFVCPATPGCRDSSRIEIVRDTFEADAAAEELENAKHDSCFLFVDTDGGT